MQQKCPKGARVGPEYLFTHKKKKEMLPWSGNG